MTKIAGSESISGSISTKWNFNYTFFHKISINCPKLILSYYDTCDADKNKKDKTIWIKVKNFQISHKSKIQDLDLDLDRQQKVMLDLDQDRHLQNTDPLVISIYSSQDHLGVLYIACDK